MTYHRHIQTMFDDATALPAPQPDRWAFSGRIWVEDGHILHEIQARQAFDDVRAGQTGGYVEHRHNLDQGGTGWIERGAFVMGDARVSGDMRVRFGTIVKNNRALQSLPRHP